MMIERLPNQATERASRHSLCMANSCVGPIWAVFVGSDCFVTSSTPRTSEMAIRASVGASCRQLLLQLLTESIVCLANSCSYAATGV